MPGTYSQSLLHFVFSTKHREPWITADIPERLYPYVGGIVRAEKGDSLTPAQRSKCMATVRGKDTNPELVVRTMPHRLGFRFRLHAPDLPGRPDRVFRSRHAVVFVHACCYQMHTRKWGRSTPTSNVVF